MASRVQWMTNLGLLTLCASFVGAQQTNTPDKTKPAQAKPAAPTIAPVIEEQAMNLLKKNQEAMLALNTYSAECHTILTRDKPRAEAPNGQFQLATLTAQKPNKMRYDRWELAGSPPPTGWTKPTKATDYTFASDGKDNYKQFGTIYRKDDRVKPESLSTILEPWRGFYAPDDSPYGSAVEGRKQGELKEARVTGSEQAEGVLCNKVFVHTVSSYNGSKIEYKTTWYIGPDGLTRRCVNYVAFDDKPGFTTDALLTNIRLNEPVNAALYAYTPPKGVTLEKDRKSDPLLANGTVAPDFAATDINNKPVKLSDLRGKVVVIDFWASWCGPCNAAMPHNQAVMKKLQAEGLPVVMLAVDDGEPRNAFETWVKQKQADLSALQFVYVPQKENVSAKQFSVTGIPTQYVVDAQGVIRASFVGFGGPSDDLEKAARAAIQSGKPAKTVAAASKTTGGK